MTASHSQRLLRAIALGSCSYGMLLKLMGPMDVKDCQRIIHYAIFLSYRGADGSTPD